MRKSGEGLEDPFLAAVYDPRKNHRRRTLEYETLIHLVTMRFQATTVSGTIFVTASILVLAQAASQMTSWATMALAYVSLLIYAIWLFGLFYPNRRIDLLNWTRVPDKQHRNDYTPHTQDHPHG
jgi:hypothetical protein